MKFADFCLTITAYLTNDDLYFIILIQIVIFTLFVSCIYATCGPTMVNKEFEFIMNLVKADTGIQAADTSQSDCIYMYTLRKGKRDEMILRNFYRK